MDAAHQNEKIEIRKSEEEESQNLVLKDFRKLEAPSEMTNLRKCGYKKTII